MWHRRGTSCMFDTLGDYSNPPKMKFENQANSIKSRKIFFIIYNFDFQLADTLFWLLYYKDITLIASVALFNNLPYWCQPTQHSLHTVSLIKNFVDLFIVFRQRRTSIKCGFMLMMCFVLTSSSKCLMYSYFD